MKQTKEKNMRKIQMFLMMLNSIILAHGQSGTKSTFVFHEPFRVEAGGEAIDVKRGDIFPEYVDFDGDGIKDLLVGDFQEGVVRVYKNHGTNTEQKFENYTLIQTEDGPAHVEYGCCVGFRPMYADLNGDGIKDILTGSYLRSIEEGKASAEGELHFFAGKGKGMFAKDQILTWPDGKTIQLGWSTSPCVTDWDGDKIPDLIVGIGEGKVLFVRNKGKMQFEPAKALTTSDGSLIKGADAGPYVVDWDGDGINDLLLGEGCGAIRFYKGSKAGNGQPPHLDSAVELIPAYQGTAGGSKPGVFFEAYKDGIAPTKRPTGRVKVSVTDWNGDGKPDLLAGDVVTTFKLPDPDTNEKQRNAAIAERDGEYKRIALIQASAKDQAAKEAEIAAVQKKIAEMDAFIRSTLRGAKATLHGYVWIYLQK